MSTSYTGNFSGRFKDLPLDISNTFVQYIDDSGNRILIGKTSEHYDISDNKLLLLYNEGKSKFTNDIEVIGDVSFNNGDEYSDKTVNIGCNLSVKNLILKYSDISDGVDAGYFDDYEDTGVIDTLLFIDASGQIRSTGMPYTKLQYANQIGFDSNMISIFENFDFAVLNPSHRSYGGSDDNSYNFIVKRFPDISDNYYSDGSHNYTRVGINVDNPSVILDISGTDAIKIPVGSTDQRPDTNTETLGMIRYNTSMSQYEGYGDSGWQGLGGVIDNDQDTKITAEDTNELKFFTHGTQRMLIDNNGRVGINTTPTSRQFEVNGNTYLNGYVTINSSIETTGKITTPQIKIATTNNETVNIDTDLNSGDLNVRILNPGYSFIVSGTNSDHYINDTLYVNHEFVGINNTSPSVALDVSGDVAISGKFSNDNGAKIVIQGENNGGSDHGIFLWDEAQPNWGIYLSSSVDFVGINSTRGKTINDTSACSGFDFEGYATRFRAFDSSNVGFIFENSSDECLVSIRGDGMMQVGNDLTVNNMIKNEIYSSSHDKIIGNRFTVADRIVQGINWDATKKKYIPLYEFGSDQTTRIHGIIRRDAGEEYFTIDITFTPRYSTTLGNYSVAYTKLHAIGEIRGGKTYTADGPDIIVYGNDNDDNNNNDKVENWYQVFLVTNNNYTHYNLEIECTSNSSALNNSALNDITNLWPGPTSTGEDETFITTLGSGSIDETRVMFTTQYPNYGTIGDISYNRITIIDHEGSIETGTLYTKDINVNSLNSGDTLGYGELLQSWWYWYEDSNGDMQSRGMRLHSPSTSTSNGNKLWGENGVGTATHYQGFVFNTNDSWAFITDGHIDQGIKIASNGNVSIGQSLSVNTSLYVYEATTWSGTQNNDEYLNYSDGDYSMNFVTNSSIYLNSNGNDETTGGTDLDTDVSGIIIINFQINESALDISNSYVIFNIGTSYYHSLILSYHDSDWYIGYYTRNTYLANDADYELIVTDFIFDPMRFYILFDDAGNIDLYLWQELIFETSVVTSLIPTYFDDSCSGLGAIGNIGTDDNHTKITYEDDTDPLSVTSFLNRIKVSEISLRASSYLVILERNQVAPFSTSRLHTNQVTINGDAFVKNQLFIGQNTNNTTIPYSDEPYSYIDDHHVTVYSKDYGMCTQDSRLALYSKGSNGIGFFVGAGYELMGTNNNNVDNEAMRIFDDGRIGMSSDLIVAGELTAGELNLSILSGDLTINGETNINNRLIIDPNDNVDNTDAVNNNSYSATNQKIDLNDVNLIVGAKGSTNTTDTYKRAARLDGDGAYGSDSNTTERISIFAQGTIVCAEEFHIYSDSRIKKNIRDISDNEALLKLRNIKPKVYNYIDIINKTNETVYGFIAQEVKEVIPDSVQIKNEYIPNIYQLGIVDNNDSTIISFEKSIDISLNLIYNNKINVARIKYTKYSDNKSAYINIIELIDDKTIKTETPISDEDIYFDVSMNVKKILVYGQLVTDFNTLKKNAIWTVTTAAVQEIDRTVEVNKDKIARLENENNIKSNIIEDLTKKIILLESRISNIERNYIKDVES